jgi:hypothetical protein
MKYKCLPVLLMFCITLRAQEATPPPELRRYTFNAYIWSNASVSVEGNAFPELYFFDGELERRFEVRRGAVSRRYTVSGDGGLSFYAKRVVEDPRTGEERVERTPVLDTRIPEGWEHALLLLFPGNSGGYSIVPVANGPERIPEGSVGVYNTGTHPLAVLQEGRPPLVIAPSSMQVFEPEMGGTRAENGFRLQLAIRRGEEWEVAYSRSHRLLPGKNPLIMVVDREGRGVLTKVFE